MAVDFQVTRFRKTSTSTNGTTQDVSLNFTPKAIHVFLCDTLAGNDDTFNQSIIGSYGFSDGTTHACVSYASEDNQATSDTGGSHRTDAVVSVQDYLGTVANVRFRASCSFITNGVRFTWDVNTTNTPWIYVIAIGGSDITNVKVNTVDIGSTAIETRDYTGLGFNPVAGESILFTLTNNSTAVNTNTSLCSPSIGFAISDTERYTSTITLEDARTVADTWSYSTINRCLSSLDATTGVMDFRADFNSWITDGFRLDIEDGSASSTAKFSYMVIKGGQWDAGGISTITTTGDQTVTLNAALATVKGVFTVNNWAVTGGNIASNAQWGMGASDGTNEGCMSLCEVDNLDPSQNISRHQNLGALMYAVVTTATTPFTPSIALQANFVSFGTNEFTVNHAVAPGAAIPIGWWAVGESGSAQQYDRPISESTISISEALARVQVKLKPISEPSISVSETLTRVQSLIKTINETAVSVSEALARVPTYLKPISETAITVSEQLTKGLVYTKPINESTISINDTIVRIPLYLKPINETAITTNDTIARWISVSYTLAEPSISVNDSIAGALFYLRQISESAISVNDTIARILTAIRAISDPSISTNDTIVRIQTLLKTISESAISVNDSVAKVPTYVKSISDETAINTNDSIVRLLAAVRTISDPSISVNDTITRIQTILKQISESAISVNDSLQAGLLLTISLVESRVKWYYSVLTRKITA